MAIPGIRWICLLLLTLPVRAAVPSPPAALSPAWSTQFDAEIKCLAISPDGAHLALATETEIVVLDRTGTVFWRTPLALISPFLHPAVLAVAPGGQWVAAAGDSSYKYVWRIRRDGSAWFFGTTGTPYALAIPPQGDQIAVGTGAKHIHLLALNGRQQDDLLCSHTNYIHDLTYSAEGQRLVQKSCYGVSVITRHGQMVWQSGAWTEIEPSPALKWFAAREYAGHGPPGSTVGLLDEEGKTVWSRNFWYGQILSAPGGDVSLIGGIEILNGVVWPERDDPAPVIVVDRKGRTLREKSLPWHDFLFTAAGGQTFVLRMIHPDTWESEILGFNRELEPVWQIPGVTAWSEHIEYHPRCGLVLFFGNTVRAYAIPEAAGGQ